MGAPAATAALPTHGHPNANKEASISHPLALVSTPRVSTPAGRPSSPSGTHSQATLEGTQYATPSSKVAEEPCRT